MNEKYNVLICRSITGKVVRFVYLVFIILVICAYTASFAVQREADSQSEVFGIDSIEELVTEDDMKFGIIDGGSTEAYLKVILKQFILITIAWNRIDNC